MPELVNTVKGKKAHFLPRWSSPNSFDSALRGLSPGFVEPWYGSGSQQEYEHARKLELCNRCAERAWDAGEDLTEFGFPPPEPGDVSVDAPQGLVDLVAVRRVLGGQPADIHMHEIKYALKLLDESIQREPVQSQGGSKPADERYVLLAQGLETTIDEVRNMLCDYRFIRARRERKAKCRT